MNRQLSLVATVAALPIKHRGVSAADTLEYVIYGGSSDGTVQKAGNAQGTAAAKASEPVAAEMPRRGRKPGRPVMPAQAELSLSDIFFPGETRTAQHERTIREFQITERGLFVGETLRGFHDILTGVPTFSGEEAKLMPQGLTSND